MKPPFPLLLALAGAAACSDSSVTGPASLGRVVAASTVAGAPVATRITVMTQNLYIGADVDQVIAALASGGDPLPALLVAVRTVEQTAYPVRAGAIADEIARARPHVVGLQEVTDLDLDLSALGIPVISQDFLSILEAALAARGLNYVLAAEMTNTAAALHFGPISVTVVDHDAILVDASRVTVGPTVTAHRYAANIGMVAPGVDLERGFVAIDATIGGVTIKVADTHLESGNGAAFAPLRAAQAGELVEAFDTATPVMLLGDFNDPPDSPMHAVIAGAGFTDAWAALRPGAAGV